MVRASRLVQPVVRVIRTLLLVILPGVKMTLRTSTMRVTSLQRSLTSTAPRVLFLSRRAGLRGRMDLVGRGGRVAEDVAAVVVGRVRVPVRLRAAAIGKVA
jgi:hypothetical protein